MNEEKTQAAVDRQAYWERCVALAAVVGKKAAKNVERVTQLTLSDQEIGIVGDAYATLLLEICLGMTTLTPNKNERRIAELKVLGESTIPPLPPMEN